MDKVKFRIRLTTKQSIELKSILKQLWFGEILALEITHIDKYTKNSIKPDTIKLLTKNDNVGYGFEEKKELLTLYSNDKTAFEYDNRTTTLYNVLNNWIRPYIREYKLEELGLDKD